ncbi:MAG: hypothetical protein DMF93_00835 [Acidobacteria bacterium]|nr:MAG: hypothetical protein DMF93_00835 [Acidobacteriota bacterium]
MLRRFEHEAEMLGRLQHPGIAQVYAFYPGDRATPAHLVMELVSGPPLTDYARAQGLTIAARAALIVKLADAVQHAHDRGVIHRDLKPANVLVAEGGQPKILDFGIARAIGADVQRLTIQTGHGQLMGTLAYMSPEQLGGRSHDVDARSDVYALGVLLYRLLANRLPFEVGDVPWLEAVQRLLAAEPPRMADVNASLSGPLEDIVARAMARDAGDRYQTAGDLATDLQRFLAGRQTIAARATRSAPRADSPVQTGEPSPFLVAADADTICTVTDTRGLAATAAATGHELWTANVDRVCAFARCSPWRRRGDRVQRRRPPSGVGQRQRSRAALERRNGATRDDAAAARRRGCLAHAARRRACRRRLGRRATRHPRRSVRGLGCRQRFTRGVSHRRREEAVDRRPRIFHV